MADRVVAEPSSCCPTGSAAHMFDPALARHSTRVLPVDELVDPLHITDAPGTVAGYRSAMERGDRFPPVSVVRLLGIWFVADGHKRFSACRSLGAAEIVVEVWPFSRWLRDQIEQGQATVRKWRTTLLRRDPGAPGPRRLLANDIAHLRRILACLTTPRASRRFR